MSRIQVSPEAKPVTISPSNATFLPFVLALAGCLRAPATQDELPLIHVASPWGEKLTAVTQRVRLRGYLRTWDHAYGYLASSSRDSFLYEESMSLRGAPEQSRNFHHLHIVKIMGDGSDPDLFDQAEQCNERETELMGTLIVSPEPDPSDPPFCLPPRSSFYGLALLCVENVACEGFSWERTGTGNRTCSSPELRAIFQQHADKARRAHRPGPHPVEHPAHECRPFLLP